MEAPEVPTTSEETKFYAKQSHYRGTAKIRLPYLQFGPDHAVGARTLDRKNVVRLLEIFRLEGCNRLEPEHYVPAIIKEGDLERAIARSDGVTQSQLMNWASVPLKLDLAEDCVLECLHGRHRLEAAKEYLESPTDMWWTVDLYSDDLSPAILLELRTEYSNARNFCDGDIYRYLRHYQERNDKAQTQKWLARLTRGKRKDIKQLQERLPSLSAAFDQLLPFIGLWAPFQLGTLHRILTLRCEEELIHYLDHIFETWTSILGHEVELSFQLDANTVSLLHMLAPQYVLSDRSRIIAMMNDRRIFPTIKPSTTRARILKGLQAISGRIPSLYTFIQDSKYLEPPAKIMRALIPSTQKYNSLRLAFRHRYIGFGQANSKIRVYRAEEDYNLYSAHESACMDIGYLQLFFFSMRWYPKMTGDNPRKDIGKPKPQTQLSLEDCWSKFAALAHTFGFDSPEIQHLKRVDPDERMVQGFLSQARPHEIYDFDPSVFNDEVQRICNVLRQVQRRSVKYDDPLLTTDFATDPVSHRCGRPYEQSYLNDRKYLFFDYIYSPAQMRERQNLTSFAVKRDIIHAFFSRRYITNEFSVTVVPGPSRDSFERQHQDWWPEQGVGHHQETQGRSDTDTDLELTAREGRITPQQRLNNEFGPFPFDPNGQCRDVINSIVLPQQRPTVILLLYWDQLFYSFPCSSQAKSSHFFKTVCSLANDHRHFIVIENERPTWLSADDVLNIHDQKLVFIGQAELDGEVESGMEILLELNAFFEARVDD